MKAIVYEKYGSFEVLKPKTIDKPVPKKNEMLVKVHATTVSSGDIKLRKSDFPPQFWLMGRLLYGLVNPNRNILGHEFSGTVEVIGEEVTRFKVGDQVFGTTTGLKFGSYAEYVCIPEKWNSGVVALKPNNLSHEEAAALPIGAMTALCLLKKAKTQKGNNVLIYGASGCVGTYAVQIAKIFGADVTGVCSTTNLELVKSIGANKVVDYTKEDITKNTETYDVVFDAVWKIKPSVAKTLLKKEGRYISVSMLTTETTDSLLWIKEMSEKGVLQPVIDRIYPLAQVSMAHEYVDKGHKKGNVIIKVI